MSIDQSTVRSSGLCLARGPEEPVISADALVNAIEPSEIESFRPLLPVGYSAGVAAYQAAVAKLTARHLTTHYTQGLEFFHQQFVPQLKQRLQELSGGAFVLDDYVAFAAGSDVDFMTHLVEAVAANQRVALYPGDWYGFRVGCTRTENIHWDASGKADLACLCVPSVRNGHLTAPMIDFLNQSETCLLNLNLYPTLSAGERRVAAEALRPVLPKSVLSVSFSRGFGLTASQLGVALVPKDHPYCRRFSEAWNWFTYFYNAIAAQAFLEFDLSAAQLVDRKRAAWVQAWLEERNLPSINSGTYYVKSFQVVGELPVAYSALCRGDLVRLCFKPPQA